MAAVGTRGESMSFSNFMYGDQSEDKSVIGKEGAVLLFSQGSGCGVGGRSDGCLLSPFAPALRVTLWEAGVL